MYSVDIKDNKEIYDFCMLNGITDINKFIQDCFKQGFHIKKYGLLGEEQGLIEKEVIKEVRVEVPVEVIKEVEKIVEIVKEIPTPPTEVEVIKYVDREVIKEVPVEKIVTKIEYICDKNDEEMNEKIFQLKQELENERQKFSTKASEMENIFQNEMSKKDKELDILRHSLDIKPEDSKTKMLETTLLNLRKELSLKNKEIEECNNKINKLEKSQMNLGAVFLKNSNLNNKL